MGSRFSLQEVLEFGSNSRPVTLELCGVVDMFGSQLLDR